MSLTVLWRLEHHQPANLTNLLLSATVVVESGGVATARRNVVIIRWLKMDHAQPSPILKRIPIPSINEHLVWSGSKLPQLAVHGVFFGCGLLS